MPKEIRDKIVTLDQLFEIVKQLKVEGKTVGWTNGCFDFMHAGHVDYLEKANAHGDVLVVGLNSDVSVRKLKGELRPICSEKMRAKVLNSIIYTDYIVLFDDVSPIKIIEQLQPDFYIKGGDYTIDSIDQNERKVVEGYNGEIVLIRLVDEISTTSIINKIKKL